MILQIQNFYTMEVFNDTLFILYLVSVLIDILTGNIVALYQRKWNSKTGLNGTLRHIALFSVMFFLLPVITFTTSLSGIANGVVLYIIGQYTISILENLSAMGFDLNESFTQYFEFLNPKEVEHKQNNKNKGEDNK